MAYVPPTVTQLSQNLRQAIKAELPASDPWIWPNNLFILSKAFAQALRGAYLKIGWLHKQAFVITADIDVLELHGSDLGIIRQPATLANGNIYMTAEIGTVIKADTRLVRSDGTAYVVNTTTTAVAERTLVPIIAEETGVLSNCVSGTTLTLETSVAAITDLEVSEGGIVGGNDIEGIESYRERILLRKRNPPHGGSPDEYVSWTRDYPGVTNVFVQRATPGPGYVSILFMMYNNYVDGLPSETDVAGVLKLLQQQAPADAALRVAAPLPLPVDIEVELDNDTIANRQATNSEVRAMFRRRATPGSTLSDYVFPRDWIAEAISAAVGEHRYKLHTPVADIVCGAGEIAVFSTLTFI